MATHIFTIAALRLRQFKFGFPRLDRRRVPAGARGGCPCQPEEPSRRLLAPPRPGGAQAVRVPRRRVPLAVFPALSQLPAFNLRLQVNNSLSVLELGILIRAATVSVTGSAQIAHSESGLHSQVTVAVAP